MLINFHYTVSKNLLYITKNHRFISRKLFLVPSKKLQKFAE